jgi:ubiquinone/menaquinone biosynthesis C-methylase UbiE
MADTSSNAIWVNADNCDDWELSRPQLFREETRDLFFCYFRIKPTYNVLEGGCGSGVLTRFIAKGLQGGMITGFDISRNFVEYGNAKIAEGNLSDRAKIVLDDGFDLSFDDGSFDAVISHNYLGVLSDPVAGLKELIRVCKIGGNIASSSTANRLPTSWKGDYPIECIDRLVELAQKHESVYRKVMTPSALKQTSEWYPVRHPRLFSELGLENISIHPVASAFAYDDRYWSDEYRRKKIINEIDRDIELYEEHQKNPLYEEYGFSSSDFNELITLLRRKQDYLLGHFNTDNSWEWSAYLHYIVVGTKTNATT